MGEALLGRGRPELLAGAGARSASGVLRRVVGAHRVGFYLTAITALAVSALTALAAVLVGDGAGPIAVFVAAILFVPVAICLAQEVLRTALALVLRPRPALPALRVDAPEVLAKSVCVIYPAILHDEDDVADLVRTMADGLRDCGTDRYLHLALVDFGDAPAEHADSDRTLAADLDERLAALTPEAGETTVAACYRARRWNPTQSTWMGWERKRGKVYDFARLATGATDTDFLIDPGLRRRIAGTDLVITLDVGCRLPDDGARRLVATMSHPMNRPVLDEATRRVVAGNGLLQPISTFNFATATSTYQSATYGCSAVLDPITARPPSAQRLFGTSNFYGQAAFDPAVFVTTLEGRIPENTVLSHDKLEGFHTRAGSAVRVVLHDEQPLDYLTDRQRFHRWFRGDFHLLPWITGRRRSPAVGALARWTMIYDLMSHLRYAVTPVLLVATWLLAPPGEVLGYTAGVLGAVCASLALDAVVALVGRTGGGRPSGFRAGLRAVGMRCLTAADRMVREAVRWVLELMLVVDLGRLVVDAFVRAGYRMAVSGRDVLEWMPAARVGRRVAAAGRTRRWLSLGPMSLFAVAVAVALTVLRPDSLPVAAPILTAWFLAPLVTALTAVPRPGAAAVG